MAACWYSSQGSDDPQTHLEHVLHIYVKPFPRIVYLAVDPLLMRPVFPRLYQSSPYQHPSHFDPKLRRIIANNINPDYPDEGIETQKERQTHLLTI